MKLWGKYLFAILSLSLLSYGVSDAVYAAAEPISVTTDKDWYADGAIITISKKELDERLSFLIEKGFISKNEKESEIFYSASRPETSTRTMALSRHNPARAPREQRVPIRHMLGLVP